MDKPTEEQIKEFWEWCGFKLRKLHPLKSKEPYFVLHKPDGEQYDLWIGKEWDYKIPIRKLYPPIDLNSLFKYAVPLLQDKGNNIELYAYEHKGYMATVYKDCFSQRGSDGYDPYLEPISQVKDDNAALALFWAIRQALKEGV